MKRIFIYAASTLDVLRANHVGDSQVRALELAIMRGDGDTVAGTGGMRKIRCASENRGKSGSVRVLFADYPAVGRTYVLAAFGKSEKGNISQAEAKAFAALKKTLDRLVERMVQNAKQN